LNSNGQPKSEGSALNTIAELLNGLARYRPDVDLTTKRIIDYAAGPGRLSRHLVHQFGEVIAVDTNPKYLAIAEKDAPPNLTTKQVDPIPKLGALPTSTVVLCVNLFLHLDPVTAGRLLAYFAQLLAANGLLALHIPIYEVGGIPQTWTSVGSWTPHTLITAAAAAGLDVLEYHLNPGAYRPGHPGPNHARLIFLEQFGRA
jgi:SAM-dependent methyltransferase